MVKRNVEVEMGRRPGSALAAAFLAVSLWAFAASAWQRNGVLICDYPGNQTHPYVAGDGYGGAIVAWSEWRGGWRQHGDIYAQRIRGDAYIPWPSEGVSVCDTLYDQSMPVLASDGCGGAIVAWVDYRGRADADIYAQRVDSVGVVKWTRNGVPICRGVSTQWDPQITADLRGGAVITWTWRDPRTFSDDIWAQRVDPAGNPLWWPDGIPISIAAQHQFGPVACSDGAGGAIVAWEDLRNSPPGLAAYDIYAQRVDSSGTLRWMVNGMPICDAAGDQLGPVIAEDDSGGAIIAWADRRDGELTSHICAQRVDQNGVTQWTANGIMICDTTGYDPLIVSDGSGGAIVGWLDHRSGRWEIYAQRVDAAGQIQWTPEGVLICDTAGAPWLPDVTSDGCGGAIIAWEDHRQDDGDIYVQRVDGSGAVRWLANGVAACDTLEPQRDPEVVTDGAGGCIVAWTDLRSGGQFDIYAQRIDSCGSVGVAEAVELRAPISRAQLFENYPNPFRGATTIRFSIPGDDVSTYQRFNLSVYDLSGRLVATLVDEKLPAGAHSVSWAPRDAPPGIYFCRLTVCPEQPVLNDVEGGRGAGEVTATRKMVLLR